jgi:hypothetical protein
MSLRTNRCHGTTCLPQLRSAVQVNLPLATFVTAYLYAPRAVTDPHALPVIPNNMLDGVRWTGCTELLTVPTFVEKWALCPENVEELKKLKSVVSNILSSVHFTYA